MNGLAHKIETWFRQLQTEDAEAAIIQTCIPREHADQLQAEAAECGIQVRNYAGFLLTMAVLRHRGGVDPEQTASADTTAKVVGELHALAGLVDEMRAAQRGYFAAKAGEPAKKVYWVKAIKLEQQVDAALRAILQPEAPPLSKGLFP